MRTTIEIDDALLSEAMMAVGQSTKRATVEAGLRLLVQVHGQVDGLAELKGSGWHGNLDEMRAYRKSCVRRGFHLYGKRQIAR